MNLKYKVKLVPDVTKLFFRSPNSISKLNKQLSHWKSGEWREIWVISMTRRGSVSSQSPEPEGSAIADEDVDAGRPIRSPKPIARKVSSKRGPDVKRATLPVVSLLGFPCFGLS
jgi:hypothetical protein